jgi:hypothetical protein
MAVMLKPIYVLNSSLKNGAGEELTTLPMGSTTLYVSAVLSPPKAADGSPAPAPEGYHYKSDFQLPFDRLPFCARPVYLLNKPSDATTPVEFVVNLTPEHYQTMVEFDRDLLDKTKTFLARYTKLPTEAKSSIIPDKTLSDGRKIDASMTARIKGWSQYMTNGAPRVLNGISFPGDPSWAIVPTTTAFAKNTTVFWIKGPASVGGAYARTTRPNRFIGPQDVRPNAMSGTAFVYVSHIWVRTIKDNTVVQYGVTYAISALYLEARAVMQSNPMGARVYDPTSFADSDFIATSEGPGYSAFAYATEEAGELPPSPPRPTKRARDE